MSVKEGYQQTEIGVIPQDWTVKPFGKIFTFLNTASYSRANITSEGEVGYIHYGDIHTTLNFHLNTDNYVSGYVTKLQGFNYDALKQGDLILADASEDYEGIGKAVEIINSPQQKVISGLHTIVARDNVNEFAIGYKGYLESIACVKKQYRTLASGLKVYGLSKTSLSKVLLPIPPKDEQEKIAKALTDTENYITSLEQLIEKKLNLKQATLCELFKESEKWQEFSLECLTLPNIGLVRGPFGGSLKKEDFIETGFKVYEQRNAIYKSIEIGNYYINNDKFIKLKRFAITEGDFILSCSGTIGKLYRIPHKAPAGIINQALLLIRIDRNKINPDYFEHYFNREEFQNSIIDGTQGGAMKNLVGMSEFRQKIIKCPSFDEQKRISEILNNIDTNITLLTTKLEKAKNIKQGMMQKLLTGEIRLTNPTPQ